MGECNCSCRGFSQCLVAYRKDDTPNAKYTCTACEDLAEDVRYDDWKDDADIEQDLAG